MRSKSGYWYLDGTTLKNNFKIIAMNGEVRFTCLFLHEIIEGFNNMGR